MQDLVNYNQGNQEVGEGGLSVTEDKKNSHFLHLKKFSQMSEDEKFQSSSMMGKKS